MENTDVKEITVNGQSVKYVGQPLRVSVYRLWKGKDGNWGGRGNLLLSDEQTKEIQLTDLDDCFSWLKRWMESDNELSYVRGYVLDYEDRTIYFDDDEALNFALSKDLRQGDTGYFVHFIKRSFTE
jgi:hypothetical protein